MVSEIFGAFANSLINQFGVNEAVANQKDLMDYQAKVNYKYSQKDLKTKWKSNRQGLEAAGYNPMLALGGVNSNSNWASQASVSDTGTGSSFGTGAANAIQSRQVHQQANLIGSQVANNNADSVLKNSQAITESFKQMNLNINSQLQEKERDLKQLDINNYERKQIREDIDVLTRYKTMLNNYELGIQSNNIAGMNAVSNRIVANSNSNDVQSRIPVNKQEEKIRKWNAKHPILSRILPGSASSGISAGATLLK